MLCPGVIFHGFSSWRKVKCEVFQVANSKNCSVFCLKNTPFYVSKNKTPLFVENLERNDFRREISPPALRKKTLSYRTLGYIIMLCIFILFSAWSCLFRSLWICFKSEQPPHFLYFKYSVLDCGV